ncbi:MAG: hypothetical protein AAFN43_01440 [Pseudomonadota bacterium]
METNTSATGQNGSQSGAGASVDQGSTQGNDQLSQAFDRAIEQAQQTLATTTIKGADLYALKQNAR